MRDLNWVPALTLQNPWAHLITHGTKRTENRVWKPPGSLTRILIHAGKGWDDSAQELARLLGDLDAITTSAIVAIADIARVCDTSRHLDHVGCGCGEWAMPSRYHWVLTNVVTLPEPVPCRGRQKLWWPDRLVVAGVTEQLDALEVAR